MLYSSLPALFCPFQPAMHPLVTKLEHHTFAWATTQGLIADGQTYHYFEAERHWRIIARAYPTLDFSQLAIIADWNTWGFCLDDLGDASQLGHDPQHLRAFMAAILAVLDESPHVPPSPIFGSVHDVWQRIIPRSTLAWRDRMRQTLRDCFAANVWEATNRAHRLKPTRRAYIAQRRHTGAWLTYVRLAELVLHIDLPPRLQSHRLLQAYLQAVNNTIVWANDLMSWQKELKDGDRHNLVLIIQAEEQCTYPEAMRRVIQMHNDEVRRCLTLEHALLALSSRHALEFNKYISFAHHFMRANLDWSFETTRYDPADLRLTESPSFLQRPLSSQTKVGLAGIAVGFAVILLTTTYLKLHQE